MMPSRSRERLPKKAPVTSIAVFAANDIDAKPLLDAIQKFSPEYFKKVKPYQQVSQLLAEQISESPSAVADKTLEDLESAVLLDIVPSDAEEKSAPETQAESAGAALLKSDAMIMMAIINENLETQLDELQAIREEMPDIPCSLVFYYEAPKPVKPSKDKPYARSERPKRFADLVKEINANEASRFTEMRIDPNQVYFLRANSAYNFLPFLRGAEKTIPQRLRPKAQATSAQFFGSKTKITLAGAALGLTGAGLYLFAVEAALTTTLIGLSCGTVGGGLGMLLLYLLAKAAYNGCCAPAAPTVRIEL